LGSVNKVAQLGEGGKDPEDKHERPERGGKGAILARTQRL